LAKDDSELKKSQPKAGAKPSGKTSGPQRPKPVKTSSSDLAAKTPKVSAAKPANKADAKKVVDESEAVSVKQADTSSSSAPKVGMMDKAKAAAGRFGGGDVRGTVIKVAAVLVAVIAVVVIVFGVLIYGYKSENSAVKAVAQVVPYPVERVNGSFVSYSDYLFEVQANERAYQNNAKLNNQQPVDFSTSDGKKLVIQIKQHALDKLESDALIAQLASQKKVKVSDKEVNDLINQLYQRYGGKDTLLKTLNQIYGWNLGDLKKVVYKQLLAKDLEDKVTSDPAVDSAAKAKAEDVLKQVKNGADFGDMAKKYSQASDAASGGDLGFFTKGQLPDNEQSAAEALQPGEVSDVIKTQYGYEIIKVIEKKDDGSIHAQHILIKTIDFNEYFQDQLKKAKLNKYIST
jgi:parvulin-like peptidyl-prolyl isomerase